MTAVPLFYTSSSAGHTYSHPYVPAIADLDLPGQSRLCAWTIVLNVIILYRLRLTAHPKINTLCLSTSTTHFQNILKGLCRRCLPRFVKKMHNTPAKPTAHPESNNTLNVRAVNTQDQKQELCAVTSSLYDTHTVDTNDRWSANWHAYIWRVGCTDC